MPKVFKLHSSSTRICTVDEGSCHKQDSLSCSKIHGSYLLWPSLSRWIYRPDSVEGYTFFLQTGYPAGAIWRRNRRSSISPFSQYPPHNHTYFRILNPFDFLMSPDHCIYALQWLHVGWMRCLPVHKMPTIDIYQTTRSQSDKGFKLKMNGVEHVHCTHGYTKRACTKRNFFTNENTLPIMKTSFNMNISSRPCSHC